MSKHDSAPTHGWVISSRVNKWLALLFVIVVIIVFIAAWTLRYGIERDCTDVYHRDFTIDKYWIHFEAGSKKAGCPQYAS